MSHQDLRSKSMDSSNSTVAVVIPPVPVPSTGESFAEGECAGSTLR